MSRYICAVEYIKFDAENQDPEDAIIVHEGEAFDVPEDKIKSLLEQGWIVPEDDEEDTPVTYVLPSRPVASANDEDDDLDLADFLTEDESDQDDDEELS